MPMNRRSFLKTLISAAGAVAAAPYLPEIVREPVARWQEGLVERQQAMIDALAQSMIETKEAMTANVLNQAFGRMPRMSEGVIKHETPFIDFNSPP